MKDLLLLNFRCTYSVVSGSQDRTLYLKNLHVIQKLVVAHFSVCSDHGLFLSPSLFLCELGIEEIQF